MRRVVQMVLLIALAMAGVVGIGRASAPTATDERDVLTAERLRFEALRAADLTALHALMRADCTYTHSTGVIQGREAYLAPIADERTRYEVATGSEMQVRIYGATAIVNGRATLNAHVEGDPNLHTNDLRYTNVWVKTDGKWQLAAWHSSRVQ